MHADIIAIGVAFILGLGARFVGLPPLVGYLVAGFFVTVLLKLLQTA